MDQKRWKIMKNPTVHTPENKKQFFFFDQNFAIFFWKDDVLWSNQLDFEAQVFDKSCFGASEKCGKKWP